MLACTSAFATAARDVTSPRDGTADGPPRAVALMATVKAQMASTRDTVRVMRLAREVAFTSPTKGASRPPSGDVTMARCTLSASALAGPGADAPAPAEPAAPECFTFPRGVPLAGALAVTSSSEDSSSPARIEDMIASDAASATLRRDSAVTAPGKTVAMCARSAAPAAAAGLRTNPSGREMSALTAAISSACSGHVVRSTNALEKVEAALRTVTADCLWERLLREAAEEPNGVARSVTLAAASRLARLVSTSEGGRRGWPAVPALARSPRMASAPREGSRKRLWSSGGGALAEGGAPGCAAAEAVGPPVTAVASVCVGRGGMPTAAVVGKACDTATNAARMATCGAEGGNGVGSCGGVGGDAAGGTSSSASLPRRRRGALGGTAGRGRLEACAAAPPAAPFFTLAALERFSGRLPLDMTLSLSLPLPLPLPLLASLPLSLSLCPARAFAFECAAAFPAAAAAPPPAVAADRGADSVLGTNHVPNAPPTVREA